MLMRMLAAGGIQPLTDAVRAADEDNPNGYFELERVKGLPADTGWLPEAEGKAVKVISALLDHLPRRPPDAPAYRVLFLERALPEVLASQSRMLQRRGGGEGHAADDARMAGLFSKHLTALRARLAARDDMQLEFVRYEDVLADPAGASRRVASFLDAPLDVEAMARTVDPALYRQRKA